MVAMDSTFQSGHRIVSFSSHINDIHYINIDAAYRVERITACGFRAASNFSNAGMLKCV